MNFEAIIAICVVAAFVLVLGAINFSRIYRHEKQPNPVYELPTNTRPPRGQWSFSKAFLRDHPLARIVKTYRSRFEN